MYKARLKQSLEYVVVKACSKDLKPRVLQEVGAGSGGGGGGCGMRGAASAPTPVRPVVESLQSSSLGVAGSRRRAGREQAWAAEAPAGVCVRVLLPTVQSGNCGWLPGWPACACRSRC